MASRDFARLSVWFCILALAATLVLSAQLQAQDRPGAGSESGGAGYWGPGSGGAPMGGPPPRRERMPSREIVKGPPSPETLRQIAELSDEETEHYRDRYDKHMATTKPMRDSLRTTMKSMRAAFEDRDRGAARALRRTAEQQRKTLSSEDEKFSKTLQGILTKDQLKRYDKWKEERNEHHRRRVNRRPPTDGHGRGAP